MTFHWLKSLIGIPEIKPDPYIHIDPAQLGQLAHIRTALGNAETAAAIELLGALDIPSIENEVTTLSGRYAALQREQVQGVLSNQEYELQLNRIHRDILSLLVLLNKSLEPDKVIRQIKTLLRHRYRKYLTDKLADRQPINIQCAYSIEGTDLEHAKIAYDEIVLEQQQVQSNLENLFDRHRGRLLIIGEPGSGKTSLLLQLADALLQRQENRVPVILNLSTWKSTYKTFDAWLWETLPAAASVSKAMAKSLVRDDRLLPLFDGLDEVAPEHRNSCLELIARYGRRADHQYVICSRIAEYAGTSGAPVYGQIKLLPLTQAQIATQLENSAQPEARFLLAALRQQPVLAKVVENPFYFNTAQLLLSSMKSLDELHIQADDEEGLKSALVDNFVVQQLNTTEQIEFPADKSRKWLGFLAKSMQDNHLARFELADLKPGWVREKWNYYLIGFIVIIVIGITDVIISLLMQNYESEALVGWPIIGVLWIVFSNKKFKTYDRVTWSLKVFKSNFKTTAISFTAGWALFIIINHMKFFTQSKWLIPIDGIFHIFVLALVIGGNVIFMILFLTITILLARMGLVKQLLIYLMFLISIFIRVFNSGLENKKIYNMNKPYKKIMLTTKVEFLYVVLFLFLISVLGFLIWDDMTSGGHKIHIVYDLILLTIFFLPYSLLFKHFAIRTICALKNNLPFRLVDFLNEMDARHLFESDGGSWRFRHKILQDYFVGKGAI